MFEPQTYAVLMLVGFFGLLMLGVPVATTLATVGFLFGYQGFGDSPVSYTHLTLPTSDLV